MDGHNDATNIHPPPHGKHPQRSFGGSFMWAWQAPPKAISFGDSSCVCRFPA